MKEKENYLRKLIREEVRAAMQEELKEILQEAIDIASTPQKAPVVYQEHAKKPVHFKHVEPIPGVDPIISKLIQETKAGMSRDDYRTVFQGDTSVVGVQKPNFAEMMATDMGLRSPNTPASLGDNIDPRAGGTGVDISNLGLDRMKKVFQASLKDRDPANWND